MLTFKRMPNTSNGSAYAIIISDGYDTANIGTIERREYDAPYTSVGWMLDLGGKQFDCDTLAEAKDTVRGRLFTSLTDAFNPATGS